MIHRLVIPGWLPNHTQLVRGLICDAIVIAILVVAGMVPRRG